jgi:hypothetical protein
MDRVITVWAYSEIRSALGETHDRAAVHSGECGTHASYGQRRGRLRM